MTNSQGKKRSYVALIEDEPSSGNVENLVEVGNCVTEKAVRRSGLLSGINTTEGLASLPGNISPQDIRLWEAESLVDIEFHPDELVAVLKVADALGDKDDAAWVRTLAGMAVETDWDDTARADVMLAALFRLPPHLLHRIFVAYLNSRNMSFALDVLPPPLHTAVIAAAANGGALDIDIPKAQAVLMHLLSTRMPPPGLCRLELGPRQDSVDALDLDEDDDPDMNVHQHPISTGALLARAVNAHPSLTALVLSGPRFRPQFLRNFAACLAPAALPRLVDLRIAVDAHPGGCAELGTALALLPTLTTLSITIVINRHTPSAELSLHSYTRLAAAPASLPSLQTLEIDERAPISEDEQACFSGGTRASVARTLLPLLSATALTSLHFKPFISKFSVRALLAQVTQARFPALRRLAFNGALLTNKPLHSGDMEGAACASRSTLPPLQEVAVGSACPESVLRIAADCVQSCAGALTSLTVVLAEADSVCVDDTCTGGRVRYVWTEFMQLVGTCRQLCKLNLSCLCGMSLEASFGFAIDLGFALAEMTALTHFALQAGSEDATGEDRTWFDGRILGRGVAGLKALECLRVGHGVGPMCLYHGEALIDACVGLERLSQLALLCDACEVRHISDAVPKMGALKELRLPVSLFPDGRDSDTCRAFVDRFASLKVELR